ncbi:hypothetical protein Back11_44150 [Paenibacillus baekrokdamisoli]|uniref:Uncharacterized protein n=1 Tax=Paenibacillus baekrokdamisoli TaxID=1712516 RepID=A0A3G9IW53_9BACL|nr:extracellular solute-binding protein [Paenibacillus baekrokdamisoli]MBB3067883.1 raffinose/stachyose/melibiose transport system substrate-binding protein [Paenibacillus baekrokdamisoli]BBH23070.1 hypothetical protein Back11_44150 [Paenibacillus baekrokdamisoli]
MRKQTLGKLVTTFLTFSLIFALAACGGTNNKESSPAASEPASSGASESSSGSEAAPKEKVKLKLYYQYGEDVMAAEAVNFRDTIKRFQEENPDIDFSAEIISPSIYMTKIQTLAAANDLPDIFPALPSMQQAFSKNNLIADLTPIFEKDAEWKNGFIPGAFDDQTYAGKIYGVPYESLISTVLYWNKDIFAKSGIDHFPNNLDEFKEAITKLKANGYIPMAMGNKTKDPLASTFMPGLVFRYMDRAWYDSVREGTGAKFTDPEYVKAIDMLGELIKLGIFNKDMNSIDGMQAMQSHYYTGKAGMIISGSWMISSMIAQMPKEILDNTEFSTLPPQTSKPELGNIAPGGTGWGYVVNANVTGAKLDAAVKFLKMLTSKEAGEKIINAGSLTAINVTPKDPSKLPPFFVKFLEFRKNVKPAPVPEIQFSGSYVEASYTSFQEYSVGGLSSAKLAEKLQAAMDKSAKK